MITCPKCYNELEDDMKFCDRCGASVDEIPDSQKPTAPVEEVIVEAPAEEIPQEVPAVETPVAEAPAEENSAGIMAVFTSILEKLKKLPKKTVKLGAIGVAAAAVVILLFSLIFGGKDDNYALYLKDEEMFYSDLKKSGDPWQVTSRLADSDYIDAAELASEAYSIASYSCISEDGKYIFFADKIDGGDGVNLYYRQVGKDKEAVKIDSDVRRYCVNKSASIVTYAKGSSLDLYQYQVGKNEKDKIAKDLRYFFVSEDGKKIVYQNDEGTLYLKEGKDDKEKLASDVSDIYYISDDFKTVYYVKDDSLYKQVIGKDKEEIASDVASVIRVYESGEVYYLKNAEGEISLMNYVEDDMKSADASVSEPTEPVWPEYPEYPDSPDSPSQWDYETVEEYDAAYAAYQVAYAEYEAECDRISEEYDAAKEQYYADYEQYEEDCEQYEAVENRNALREALKGAKMETSSSSLCYYNGKESVVVSDVCEGWTTYAEEAAVLIYEACSQGEVSKVKMSEIDVSSYWFEAEDAVSDVEYMVQEAMYSDTENFIAVEGTATAIDEEKAATCFRVNKEGTQVFYIDDVPAEKEHGTLYSIEIKKGKPGKAEAYDEDVYTGGYCTFTESDSFIYFKDYKDGKGELYMDKEKVDYDVYGYGITVDEDNNVVYFADWNDEKNYGTLKIFEGKEPEKISDDVHTYVVTPDGRVLYLYDYSTKYDNGELHVWDNGKSRKVDEDVIAILPIIDYEEARYRGSYW